MIRNRSTRDPLKVVRQLDAFPKVPEEYRTSTKIGGTRKHICGRIHFVINFSIFHSAMFADE